MNDEDCIIQCPTISKNIAPALARVLMRNNRIRQHTKLWFTTRTRLITCSDIASVIGENPYSSRNKVFNKKTGQSRPFRGNSATRRGTELEPIAICAYQAKFGKTVWPEDIGLCLHPTEHLIGGSPDGITMDGILLEIKCPLSRKIIPGYIPFHYIAQVQVLLEIFDLETAHFVQFRPESLYAREICDLTVVKRDRGYFARVLPILQKFMRDITEFYEQKQLPIGTPMIDWDAEDMQARQAVCKEKENGIGTVCRFVDSPRGTKRKFIIERYNGPDKPMMRSEFDVQDTKCHDEHVRDAQFILNDCCTFDIDGILNSIPPRYRRSNIAPTTHESESESEPNPP